MTDKHLRDVRGARTIGGYSSRAWAPVAALLFREEVENGGRADRFTIAGMPWRPAALQSAAGRRELGR